ncbi:MAG: UDP-glucose 4-epimerase [Bacteriovoracaceae bacterium]|jgi:UDP-glucose 4-epimerase
MKNVLVTGVSGLIGHAVASELLKGDYFVYGLDCNNLEGSGLKDNFEFISTDIASCDLHKVLAGKDVDAVIHCAAHPGGKSLKEPLIDVEINATGSMKIFEWCIKNSAEVIYLSSSAVYGSQPDFAIKEDVPLDPGTIYAICKVANERFLKTLGEGYDLNWKVVRLFATYGSGHKPNTFQGIVNIMLTQLMDGNKIVVKGSLDRVRGLVYVTDAAKAIVRTLESEKAKNQVINIAHEKPATILEIIKEICVVLNKDFTSIEIIEEDGTVGDTFYNYADVSKQRAILNFSPEHNLNSGLKKLVASRLES